MNRAVIAWSLGLFALAPAHSETLADAIALAYRTNPNLESSRYDLRGVDEGLVQARAQLRPTGQLDVTGSYARNVPGRVSQSANPVGRNATWRDDGQAQIVVNQPIYTGGRATAARASAIASIRAGREVLRGAEGDLLLAVITAYVDVRRFESALGVWNDSVTELEKITREVDARRTAGEVTLTDVAQVNAQLSIARQQAVATEQALEAARTDYAALVGRSPGALAGEPALPGIPNRIDDAFALAEEQNPELARAVFVEEGSRADIAAAKSQGRPTLALRGTAGFGGDAALYRFRDQDQAYAGSVTLSLPLTAGGLVASQIRQAEDRNSSDRYRIESARREAYRAVSYAWNQMVTATRAAALQAEQRTFAATQLDGMINEYRVGLRSTFDVLYAQQQLRDAEVALLASERDEYVSQAQVLRQTGLLEANAVLNGTQLHEPGRHLHEIERRNVVPWEAIVAAMDKAGTPGSRRRPVRASVEPGGTASIAPAAPKPEARSLVRTFPNATSSAPSLSSVRRSKPL